MSYTVRFTEEAEADLVRLYELLLEQDPYGTELAERALARIVQAIDLLKQFPFTCRKTLAHNPYLRELVISFGAAGYVALFEIERDDIVTILAVRHQRESDYH
ncbi:type II toxin-antitoxin system RelE/ParE family toxin, partial [Pusillimonas sp.]|uniref:type II toxin-antitoxin system RelE/ParE family toxin n=1 Tax=Pusillimonas sp. TaxID=3040095 RepID=UPI0037CCB138